MSRLHQHPESHLVVRIGWLRAAVLDANDGIVSTASLIVGVAAATAKPSHVLIVGVAGLVAGAMSMAAGEYVSVSSQSDIEQADLARERKELSQNVAFEHEELGQIHVQRGVEPGLARQVVLLSFLEATAEKNFSVTGVVASKPAMPHTPCPEVQPPLRRVPKPTSKPATTMRLQLAGIGGDGIG